MSTLFIGLGGVGTGTLDHLSSKMDVYNADLLRQNKPQVSAHYYYIDTENARYDKHPEEFQGGTNKTFHPIGRQSPDSIVNGIKRTDVSQYNALKEWYDAPSKTTNMMAGADTIRQYSRLAFQSESGPIRNELETLIQKLSRQNGRIYVITGSCGGTGCGIYMDLLYMISEIFSNQNTNTTSTDLRFLMAMPEGYVSDGSTTDVQYRKKMLNAFATLEELNAVCKAKESNPSLFNGCYVGQFKKQGVFQPFRFGYLFDSAGLTRDVVSQKVSDFLFELELAGDPSNAISTNANYQGSYFDGLMTGTVDGNWNDSRNNNYVKAFNALGQYSIEKPDFLYRTYFSDRLLFEVFHYGLVGRKEAVNADKVTTLATRFKTEKIDPQIANYVNTIMSSIVSKTDFDTDAKANNTFSVFSTAPADQEDVVKKTIEQKNVLLQKIKAEVYSQCKEWLGQYDFATVYALFEQLDNGAYQEAVTTNEVFADQLAKAKDNAKGGILKKEIKPDKALKEFKTLLHTWLAFEVNKALSSGVNVDITIKSQGFYDNCKAFIEKARRAFALDEEYEHWDQSFVKKVGELKAKDDRSYIPDLNTFTNDQGRIVEDSDMVKIYDENVVVKTGEPDFMQGTCTPVSLHGKIIETMKSNVNLVQEGIDMGEIFDPTPGKTNSLSSSSKAESFIEKYVSAAKEQINILLENNNSYKTLFANDILTRLQNLPIPEKTKKCLVFTGHNKVQLKVDDGADNVVTQYTYYIAKAYTDTRLMQALGILDATGAKAHNSDHSPANDFFGDKIVKLIVKNGYKIDDYRYFEGYKTNAQEKLTDKNTHDPFIDKRFLGEPDKDGKYPCNVSEALNKIAEDAQAAQQAEEHSLDGCGDVEVYQYCLALLYQYFKSLQDGNKIETELTDGITVSGNVISVKDFSYDKSIEEYELGNTSSIDLSILKNLNNMLDLNTWINHLMKKKKAINDEKQLYIEAFKYLKGIGIVVSQELKNAVNTMRGDDSKPVYDFFTAYLDWYNKD